MSSRERGAAAVEYAMLLVGIVIVLVVAIIALGPIVLESFDDTCDEVDSAHASANSVDCDS